jgi:hypothetical protein
MAKNRDMQAERDRQRVHSIGLPRRRHEATRYLQSPDSPTPDLGHSMIAALWLVYGEAASLVITIVTFTGMTILLLWSSQVLTVQGATVHVFVQTGFVAAALLISALFAILLPVQVYAIRLAAATTRQTGGTLVGALMGTASMSCRAPVILPSILSMLGFSGTTILSFNLVVERYWLPLATASVLLLVYSLISVVRSLEFECSLPNLGTALPGER